MKIATYRSNGFLGLAISLGSDFHALSRSTNSSDPLLELLQGHTDLKSLASAIEEMPVIDLSQVELQTPIVRPPKIICVGLNYADHAAEIKIAKPDYPALFGRFQTTLIGHNKSIVKPLESDELDYEAELVIIVGKGGRHIAKEHALEHVAGYSLANDATLRDYQFRSSQWTAGKNFDSTGSIGPCLVTADSLPLGCRGLKIEGRLNGKVVQTSSIDELIFDVETLISLLSEVFTLEVGDVILTGTPAGVGMSRTPKLFMKVGDVYEVEIEGIGILRNPVVADVSRGTA